MQQRPASASDESGRPAPGQRSRRTVLLVAVTLALALCLCCCAFWLITPRTGASLMCQVSDTWCNAFCRSAPEACLEMGLPLTPAPGP